jgi:integrase
MRSNPDRMKGTTPPAAEEAVPRQALLRRVRYSCCRMSPAGITEPHLRLGGRPDGWVPVPELLLDVLLESTPPDDRDEDTPLFTWPHKTAAPGQTVHKVMQRTCKSAGIPHHHPHDLRHRRISLWHAQGVPARETGERVGQRQISTTLNTYTHVMAGAEVPDEALGALLVWW